MLAGNPATAPDSPTREDFDFIGWFRSADENATLWNFSTDRVNSDLTLYAHWSEIEETPAPSDTLTFEKSTAGEGYIVTGDSGQAANIVIPDEYNGANWLSGERFSSSPTQTEVENWINGLM